MSNNNHQNDLVTIVTVTFNAEEMLEETILSVINQTYNNIEYIIIDGASTDNTVEIIKKHNSSINYWVSEPDNGIYFAMNTAVEKASGVWINFMNAGDTFTDLDVIQSVMDNKNITADLIYGDSEFKHNRKLKKAYNKSRWFKNMPFCHQSLFTRLNILKDTPFDTHYRLAADHDFIVKMYKANKSFCYIERSLAIFDNTGFAINNKFLMYLESLLILMRNDVPEETIQLSGWYNNLKKHILNTDSKKEHTQDKQLQQLLESLKELTNTSTIRQPIKKIKKYKELIRCFHKINKL